MNNDLISRSALLKELDEYNESALFDVEAVKDLINDIPTVEDRPQGKWKTVEGYDGDEYYECSNCGEPWVLTTGTPEENNMNFCPNCGADMQGNKKETTFDDYLKEQLKDPEFRKEWEKLCDEDMQKGGSEG